MCTNDVLSGFGAAYAGGRFNPKSIRTVYTAKDAITALIESAADDLKKNVTTKSPRVIVAINVNGPADDSVLSDPYAFGSISSLKINGAAKTGVRGFTNRGQLYLDLTDDDAITTFGVLTDMKEKSPAAPQTEDIGWKKLQEQGGKESKSQALGRAVYDMGFAGILFKSNADTVTKPFGVNMAAFSDNLEPYFGIYNKPNYPQEYAKTGKAGETGGWPDCNKRNGDWETMTWRSPYKNGDPRVPGVVTAEEKARMITFYSWKSKEKVARRKVNQKAHASSDPYDLDGGAGWMFEGSMSVEAEESNM